ESANWYDKIDDYLDGRLSAFEKEEMDAAIQKDVALAHELKGYKMEREAMEILSEEKSRSDFMRWTEDIPKDPLVPKPLSWWHQNRWPISMVGVLLIVLMFWVNDRFIFSNPKSDTTPAQTPAQEPVLSPAQPIVDKRAEHQKIEKPSPSVPNQHKPPDNSRSFHAAVFAKKEFSDPDNIAMSRIRGGGNTDIQFSEALKAYLSAKSEIDYANAGELLNKIGPNSSNYWLSIYLKGHAYFKSEQYEKAADAFRDVAAKGMPYSPDAKWKEALSLFATGGKQKQRLREILSKISSPEKQEKAKEMLGKLK
ncbi:MAG: hypothetical protein H7246_21740, partial [Phycisphaerae bacterium]|nr:hypothetical protein [Saprospiraceae bacterium]